MDINRNQRFMQRQPASTHVDSVQLEQIIQRRSSEDSLLRTFGGGGGRAGHRQPHVQGHLMVWGCSQVASHTGADCPSAGWVLGGLRKSGTTKGLFCRPVCSLAMQAAARPWPASRHEGMHSQGWHAQRTDSRTGMLPALPRRPALLLTSGARAFRRWGLPHSVAGLPLVLLLQGPGGHARQGPAPLSPSCG